jgi:hypothetical protein
MLDRAEEDLPQRHRAHADGREKLRREAHRESVLRALATLLSITVTSVGSVANLFRIPSKLALPFG